MSYIRPLRSRYQTAVAVGVCAALGTYLPPLSVSARLDAKIHDFWQRIAAPAPSPDLVLVTVDDDAALAGLAEAAADASARLLVATTTAPPPGASESVLGPTQIALGAMVLRSTDWTHGGHLWFEPDIDGVVRTENPLLADLEALPSLSLAAFRSVVERGKPDAVRIGPKDTNNTPLATGHAAGRPAAEPAAAGTVAAPRETSSQPGSIAQRAAVAGVEEPRARRIRFYDASAFTRLTLAQVVAGRDLLSDRIVIAGRDYPRRLTPLGALPDHELVAHVLSSYRDGSFVAAQPALAAIPWAIALLPLLALARRPRWLVRIGWALPLTGIASLAALGGGAMVWAGAAVPITAPLTLVSTAGVLIAGLPRRRFRFRRRETTPTLARDLFAAGKLTEAWAVYREIPPTKDLLVEMYDLGKSLENAGYLELAADAFHRITLVDAHFRDAARCLVTTSHSRSHSGAISLQLRGELPDHLGRYELLEPIGQGSAGKVFLGRDPKINRLVAVKVIDLLAEYEPEEFEEGKDHFRREAETAGRLNHPDIVTVFDIGETDGLAYIAMEYLKGRHLSDFAHPDCLLPIPLVLDLGARVADALDYAHSQNVVHRDIKPANIMYDSISGALKITDFGIARLIDVSRTRTGIVLGTPSYMAPEQLEGRNVNGHTDLFALGVTIYELLTGRLPFRGASMTKLMFVIANEPHQPMTALRPDLPKPLDALLDMALAKDSADRFQSGAEMAHALREVAVQMA